VLHPDPTIEELDEWVVALGGRELSKEEFSRIVAEVRWHDVPGERIDPERGVCAAPPALADRNA